MAGAMWLSDKIIVFEARQYEFESYFATYKAYDPGQAT